jgi:NitT/TauT family transport system substrate-binding protein
MYLRLLLAALTAMVGVPAAQAQQHTVRVAVVRALTSTPVMIADQKGYFREHGIKVEVSAIDTTALVPLAQNQVQVMEAGMTAAYFNSLEKNFPITIATDRAATPILHKLLIRPDLKDQIKTIADLKGRAIAINGTASVVNYELGKLLETVGLTIKDVELKVLPFPQMGVGLANKAVDAAVAIPPWAFQLVDQNIGVALADIDRQAKSAQHRGGVHQYRLGAPEPRGRAQFLRRLYPRRARVLPGLSPGIEPPGK